MNYNDEPLVLLTITALIICGGLGFIVWQDLVSYRRTKRLTLHSKVVLIANAVLVVGGALLIFLLERANPATLGALDGPGKALASLFQSVTLRTAGFNSVDFGAMHGVTKVLSVIWMFIGAGSGSTGGGIKVTTFAVILMTVVSVIRNREDTEILGRRVSKAVVYKSLAILSLALGVVMLVSSAVYFLGGAEQGSISGINALFETVSAFGTVGVSAGVTGVAGWPSQLLLALTMFVGRVGPVSLALSLTMKADARRKNQVIPEGKIVVG